MDSYRDVKRSMEDRLGDRNRISSRIPEFEDKKRVVKPKYDMDERILDCMICKYQLTPPVCQCKNNHLACQACCKRLPKGQCPKCSHPIGRKRNKAIEAMIASLCVPCKHGCRKMLTTATKKAHEHHECELLLLHCPFPGCQHSCPLRKYSSHVNLQHNNARVIAGHNPDTVLLTFGAFHVDSRDELVVLKACPQVFLLHLEETDLGQMLYVTSHGKDKRYSMDIEVIGDGDDDHRDGSKTFRADDIVTRNQGRTTELRDFLLVPKQNGGPASTTTRRWHPWRARCTISIPQD